jgi:ribosomal protein S18 acetylase RimI-like enzyme
MNPDSGNARRPPRIRGSRREELGQVLELWMRAAVGPGATDDAAALRALLAFDPDALIVAEADGRLLGALIVAWDGWRANMYRLCVHPDHRRCGIARQLIRGGEESARAKGARRISALVLGDDRVAQAAWEAAGYRPHERMGRFVKKVVP